MDIIKKSFGFCRTNCYILKFDFGEFIIDPGDGAFPWIKENVKNPKAILNTHGHFDHIYDDEKLKDLYKIPIYLPQKDEILIKNDPFKMIKKPFLVDYLIKENEEISINNIKIKFHHFPGHTPGCSAIEIEDKLWTGDFIFKGQIGNYTFPFGDKIAMKNSLEKILTFKNMEIFPGHGENSTLDDEKENLIISFHSLQI